MCVHRLQLNVSILWTVQINIILLGLLGIPPHLCDLRSLFYNRHTTKLKSHILHNNVGRRFVAIIAKYVV